MELMKYITLQLHTSATTTVAWHEHLHYYNYIHVQHYAKGCKYPGQNSMLFNY